MGEFGREIGAVAMAIIGLAIIAVLVRQGSQTAGVISASTSGFANVLGTAMGGGNSSITAGGF